MIHEGAPWKAALLRDAELLTRWAVKPWTERRAFLIERKLFLAAYSLRKLADDHKLSTATLATQARVKLAPPLKPRFSGMMHWLDRYFDLDNPMARVVPWRRVVNMMIHSVTFAEVVDHEDRCVGFMVTSDQELRRGLVKVELADFLGLMRAAADDYPTAVRQVWDEKSEQWITWAGRDETR